MVLRIVFSMAILVWAGAMAAWAVYWRELPTWAMVLIGLYSFVVLNDFRIFRFPFMSDAQIDREFK